MRGMLKILAVAIFSPMFAPFALAQSGPTWIQLFPSADPSAGSPAPRVNMGAAYDSLNHRMIIFGGFTGSFLNDVWVLSDAVGLAGTPQWSNLLPSAAVPGAPTPRWYPNASYDPGTNRMIMFGGLLDGCISPSNCVTMNDVWVVSNANGLGGASSWAQLAPTGGPPAPRYCFAGTYDRTSNGLTIAQGNSANQVFSDVWVLINANNSGGSPAWTQLNPAAGANPGGRCGSTGVYDPMNNRLILFGGQAIPSPFFNDVWVLSNANGLGGTPTWTQLNTSPDPQTGYPVPRIQHSATYDPGTNRMTIFGGSANSGALLGDAWVLANANGLGDQPTWSQLNPQSPAGNPGARQRHVAVYDAASNRMTVFDGNNNSGPPFNDVWVLTNANGLSEIPVSIQIKPPTAPPVPINLGSDGVISVAILSTRDFNATLVDPASINLSGAEVKLKGKSGQYSCSIQDVNGDGLNDLLCQVVTDQLQLQPGASTAVLTGTTTGGGGQAIRGSEAIFVVPN